MNYRNILESKLRELEGGTFQVLCNELLEQIGYGKVTNSGGQTGTNKTITGTPDAYILNAYGKYIFIEYTTKQTNVCAKLMEDIKKCFNEDKTNIKVVDIEKLIVVYNSKLSVGEIGTLSKLCEENNVEFEKFDLDNISHLLVSKYPFIAKDYLGVPIDKGQFLNLKTFIKMNDDVAFSTPLSLEFFGRGDKIVEFQDLLDENDFLVVSGKTGLGKTKFVCEAMKSYENKKELDNLWFIKDKGQGLYEELIRYTSNGNHLIFFDDINKLTSLDELLYYIVENRGRIKIVATVRDYALNSTLAKISRYIEPCTFELDILADEDIIEIVKSNFGIYNSDFYNHIVKLSKGNVRLAVMMASVAKKEDTFKSIQNIGQILEKYYEFMREKLDNINETSYLKALGALSFLDKLHIKSEEIMNIVSQLTSISKDELVEIYKKLHYDEIVNIYEDEVVVIPDQIVSVFIFHYVYEVRYLLDYSDVVNLMFPASKNRIVQNVNAVLAYYGNIEFFSNAIRVLWQKWKTPLDDRYRELVLTFWFVEPEETLLYISNEIDHMPFNNEICSEYLIDNNTRYELLLSSLGQFNNDENLEIAIELALKYLERDCSRIIEVSKMFIEHFGYNLESYKQGYQIQKILLDKIESKLKEVPHTKFDGHKIVIV